MTQSAQLQSAAIEQKQRKAKSIFFAFLAASLLLFIVAPIAHYHFSNDGFHGRHTSIVAPDFELLNSDNQPHSLSQHQGRYTFVYFGYIHCDGICHNQVGTLFNINQHAKQQNLDFIFISLDPKRDDALSIKNYFDHLGSNFYGLRAANDHLTKQVTAQYKYIYYADKLGKLNDNYQISHPGSLFLVNPQGDIELTYQNPFVRYDDIIEDLQKLQKINQKTPLSAG